MRCPRSLRVLVLLSIATVLTLGSTPPAAVREEELDNLDELLGGAAEIGAPSVPGPLSIHGPGAYPVIVGATCVVYDPVVAASRWEADRVVVLGHDG